MTNVMTSILNETGFPKPTLIAVNGKRDVIPKFEGLSAFVPKVEEVSLDCGHWIQQELPEATNQAILKWLEQQDIFSL